MPKGQKDIKEVAEAAFKRRERQASEGAKAKAEHDARAIAVDANTARLRALRLEKEQADRLEAALEPALEGPAPKAKRSGAKRP